MERPARADKCVRTVQYTNSAPGSKLLDPDVPPSGRPRWHLATVTFSTERSKCVSYMHQATSRLTVSLVLPHRSFEQTFDMQVLGGKKNVLLDAVIIMTIQAAAGELGHAALQAATRRPEAC